MYTAKFIRVSSMSMYVTIHPDRGFHITCCREDFQVLAGTSQIVASKDPEHLGLDQ